MTNTNENQIIVRSDGGWDCLCGNTECEDGFYAASSDGALLVDDGGSPLDGWDVDHHVCASCGRFFRQNSASDGVIPVLGRGPVPAL